MNGAVSEFVRWDAGCWSYGSAVIDSYHNAFDYGQPYPCPNGLGLSEHTTENCQAWRRRVEKARQDAEQHRTEIDIQITADRITDEQMELFLLAFKGEK